MSTTRDYTRERIEPGRRPGAPLERLPEREPVPPQSAWRETIAASSTLNVIAGIWLIIAPWVLGYVAGDPKWNDVVFGAIVGVLALLRTSGIYATAWASAVNLVIGAWLFASAFWLDKSNTAGWNDIILGVIVFVLAAISLSAQPATPVEGERNGGYRVGSRG
jgi:SPW repeat